MQVFSHHDRQRLSVAAVRDCGPLSCPPTPKFERGRMLELPLKPLLLLHFVIAIFIIHFQKINGTIT